MTPVSAKVIQGLIAVCSIFIVLVPFFILLLVFMLPMCPKNSCDDYWKKFPYIVLQLLAIPAFFGAITLFVLFKQAREYFIENFDEYRCKPWFMPFVSFVKADVDPGENLQKCLSGSCGSVFAAMTTPFLNMTGSMGNGMNIAHQNFEQVQRNHLNLGNDMISVMGRSNQQMGKVQAITTYMFLKMKGIFDKLMALVFDFYFALVTMLDLVNIMILMPQYFIAGIFITFWIFFGTFIVLTIIAIIYFSIGFALLFNPFTFAAGAAKVGKAGVVTFIANSVHLFIAMLALTLWGVLRSLDLDAQRASDRLRARNRRRRFEQGQ